MPDDLFLRCSDDIRDRYLSFPKLVREFQTALGGDMEYCVLDIETTGFDPERDKIIEVGAINAVGEKAVERLSSFIDPCCAIPTQIRMLTGIDEDTVAGAPTIEAFFDELVEFIGDRSVVAYSRFEEEFLRALYTRLGYGRFTNPYVDAHDLATILMPSLRGHRQVDLASIWGIETGRAHRAIDDAETLFQVFNVLLNGLYNAPLPLVKSMVDHAPTHGGGLTILLNRVLEERSGGRRPEGLKLDRAVRKDRFWEDIVPLEGSSGPKMVQPEEVREIFAAEGPIAQQFRDYEERDEQVEMAEAVRRTFCEERVLLVEAGTGTGKSLAYLAPGVLWSKATGYPVVVSTRTLNLQDQLNTKDLPTLEAALGKGSFRYSVLKGYGNYLCLRKLQALVSGKKRLSEHQLGAFGMLLTWVSESDTGDTSLLNVPHLRGLDEQVMANHRECPGGRCRFAQEGCCFYRRALYRAKRSHIVVVNHSLLLAGINLAFKDAVIDEAHTLEDVATDQFTIEVDYRESRRFIESLYAPLDGSGFLADAGVTATKHLPEEAHETVRFEISEAQEAAEVALEDLEKLFVSLCAFSSGGDRPMNDVRFSEGQVTTMEFTRLQIDAEKLAGSLDTLQVRIMRVKAVCDERGDPSTELDYLESDLEGKAVRALEHIEAINIFFSGESDGRVRWATVTGSDRFEYQAMRASPIDVGPALKENLFDDLESVVLTSATLTVKDSFEFLESRVGLDLPGGRATDELILDSSFDYSRQMQILLLHDMPDPGSSEYEERIADVLGDAILAAGGGVLVLFTNRRLMMNTYERLVDEMRRQGLKLLCQLPGFSRRRLAEEFVEDQSASLFGTSSFWEGVDARGSTLRLVVVTRIPFESPGRPVFEARSERVRLEGRSDFMDLSLPLAALRLKQGVGRLIRTRQDRGQVLLMDSRINTRRYGQVLLRSLPEARRRKVSIDDMKRAISDFHGRSQ
ncbi:MAG: helicase C-terminal domain-containing protein [Candidatus Geothermincolia bacterium]